MEGDRAAPIDSSSEKRRLVVGERALAPIVPNGAGDVVENIGRRSGVDVVVDQRRAE